MLVTIKAAKGRHVFVGEAVLPQDRWSTYPISASIVKGIKVGDILEATPNQLEKAIDAGEAPAEAADESPRALEGKPVKK